MYARQSGHCTTVAVPRATARVRATRGGVAVAAAAIALHVVRANAVQCVVTSPSGESSSATRTLANMRSAHAAEWAAADYNAGAVALVDANVPLPSPAARCQRCSHAATARAWRRPLAHILTCLTSMTQNDKHLTKYRAHCRPCDDVVASTRKIFRQSHRASRVGRW